MSPSAKGEQRNRDPQQVAAPVEEALSARHGVPPSWVTSRRRRALSARSAARSARSVASSEPAAVQDRAALRGALLRAPWDLDAEAAEWIVDSGIGYLTLTV